MIVGLTGGIGSGKTTVGKMFMKLGVPIYNSDDRAKELMHSSTTLKTQIIALLGAEAYHENELNRAYIAAKVFKDSALLSSLNALVHPAVREDFKRWVNEQNFPYVIQETAILFENNMHENYAKIILVTALEKTRIARVLERDNTTEEAVLSRIRNQWEDAKKMQLAHFVIVNEDLEATYAEVCKIHKRILNTCH